MNETKMESQAGVAVESYPVGGAPDQEHRVTVDGWDIGAVWTADGGRTWLAEHGAADAEATSHGTMPEAVQALVQRHAEWAPQHPGWEEGE